MHVLQAGLRHTDTMTGLGVEDCGLVDRCKLSTRLRLIGPAAVPPLLLTVAYQYLRVAWSYRVKNADLAEHNSNYMRCVSTSSRKELEARQAAPRHPELTGRRATGTPGALPLNV